MANTKNKHKENTSGSWYCTDTEDSEGEGCIACCACFGRAPQFFAEDDAEICQEQLDNCPVNAIGKDGQ